MLSSFKQLLKGQAWNRIGRVSAVRLFFIVATMSSAFLLPRSIAAPSTREVKRVLIFYEFGLYSPGVATIDQGILAELDKSPYQIELYREYLETTLFPDVRSQTEIREWYIHKYQQRRPDLIITVGPSPLQFMVDAHAKFFKDIPIVFTTSATMAPANLDAQFSGVEEENIEVRKTVDVALTLQSGTKRVVVVAGTAPYDRYALTEAKQDLRSYDSKLDITYLTDLTMPQLLEKLEHLPEHTIVLLTNFAQDASGAKFISSRQAAPLIATSANAPVFSISDVDVGYGEEGGSVVSFAKEGQIVGDTALRILKGERVQDIPTVKLPNIYLFDWRALKRWGLKESNLPPGSIVLNREPTLWESYKWYIVGGLSLILLQTLLILGLLWQRAIRRKTEAQLRRSEEKFSKSFRHSPLVITITRISDARYLEVNDAFEEETGWKREEVIGRTPFDIHLWEDPEKRARITAQLLANGTVRDVEFKVRRKDGQILTALGSAELIEVNGEPCTLSVATNITERKAAEEVLAGVSRKLVEAQEAERTRIARELHDDINQRLAMVAINLKMLKHDLSGSGANTSHRIEEACAQVSELENDIQTLSHRLHSSGLEYLGLEAAVSGFCRELSERQNLEIHVRFDNVPETLPHEVSLCLFRVLQEAVHNAVKYSGVREFDVSLTGMSNEIQLAVHDTGVGFDPSHASNGHGLGLTSMRERLRLVNGQLSIESKPQHGTTVLARVPLDASVSAEPGIASADAVA